MKYANSSLKMMAIGAVATVALLAPVHTYAAANLAGWNVTGLVNSGPSPFAATSSDPNLTVGGLTKGPGVVSTTTGSVFGGNSWTNIDKASAITIGHYVTFTVTPNSGNTVSLSWISNTFSVSATGPTNVVMQYSTDGTTFIDIATNILRPIPGTATTTTNIFNLTGISALQNLISSTTVTFRYVAFGGTFPTGAGTFYINHPNAGLAYDFGLYGAVSCSGVPPNVTSILPASITTNESATVSFTVSATGCPASNLWYKVVGLTTNFIPTATTATLTLANVSGADTASYFVTLTNNWGTNTSGLVSLTVQDPAILVQPNNAEGLLNGQVQYTVSAVGSSSLSYQWCFVDSLNNLTAVQNGTQASGSIASGVGTSFFTLTNLHASDATNFAVVVTDTQGSITSSIVSLTDVTNHGTLAYWDFNGGNVNFTNPTPYIGVGTTYITNCVNLFPPQVNTDGNDNPPFNTTHLPNNSMGTTTYPTNNTAGDTGVSNKTAGVVFNVNTVGAKNLAITYDCRVTATSSEFYRLQYMSNGTDWIDYPTSTSFNLVASTYVPFSFSLAGFPGAANNPNFAFRIVSEFVSTATYGVNATNAYLGDGNQYGSGGNVGTVTYDIVRVTGDAITNTYLPPSISSIPNTNTLDYVPLTLNFTIGDAVTPAGSLQFGAQCLDPTFIVNPTFSYGGSGSNRTLTITPNLISDNIDAAPILVGVTNAAGDFTLTWFNMALTSSNLPPTNSLTALAATNTLANTALTIPFHVSDDHSAPGTFTYSVDSGNNTLVPAANIVVTPNGANPTVTITPANNQLGVGRVSVTVNDQDTTEPKGTTANIAFMVRPNTNVVAIDYFNYDSSGPIETVSSGFWSRFSGIFKQMQAGGGAAIVNTVDNTENVQTPLLGAPYRTNSAATLYSSFMINLPDPSKQPRTNGTYFAVYNDGTGNITANKYECRVLVATNGAAAGNFRVGIMNFGADVTDAQMFPMDLAQNSNYVVVTKLVLSNGFSTLWLNPIDQNSLSVSDNAAASASSNLVNIADFELRESGVNGGLINVSRLKVGTTFDSVFPGLHLQGIGTNAVLNWSDPTLSIQSATAVQGPYSDIPGASPPYTNGMISPGSQFFRFKPQ